MITTSATFKQKIKDGVTPQELYMTVGNYYLFSRYGDFDSSGITVTEYANPSTDITYGETPSNSFSATIVNRFGERLSFLNDNPAVSIYVGVQTSTSTYTVPSGANAYVECNGVTYTATDAGLLRNGTAISGISDKIYSLRVDYQNSSYTVVAYGENYKYEVEDSTLDSTNAYGSIYEAKYFKECKGFLNYMDSSNYSYIAFFEDGVREDYEECIIGTFIADKPSKTTTDTVSVSGYDEMQLLDIDASEYLEDVTYPITIRNFIDGLCTHCGTNLSSATFPHETESITSGSIFPSGSYTCRQLVKWVAEYGKCYARFSRAGGYLAFVSIGTTSVASIGGDHIAQDGLDVAEYTTKAVDKLVVKNLAGVSYIDGTGDNIYNVTGNPFWQNTTSQGLSSLSIPTYVPIVCTVLEADPSVECGDLVTMEVPAGSTTLLSLAQTSILANGTTSVISLHADSITLSVPIMSQTLKWNGTTRSEIVATGGETREITSETTDLNYNINCANNSEGLVNKIMASNLWAQDITATNFNLEGGSIDIETSAETDDKIELKYGDQSAKISPNAIKTSYTTTTEIPSADRTYVMNTTATMGKNDDYYPTYTTKAQGFVTKRNNKFYTTSTGTLYDEADYSTMMSGDTIAFLFKDTLQGYNEQITNYIIGGQSPQIRMYEANNTDNSILMTVHSNQRIELNNSSGAHAWIQQNYLGLTDASGNEVALTATGITYTPNGGTSVTKTWQQLLS